MEQEYDNWRPLHNVISRVLPPPLPPVCVDETGGGGDGYCIAVIMMNEATVGYEYSHLVGPNDLVQS